MPNHCHNDLWIDGTQEDVAKLLAHIGADRPEPEFDFNTLIKYPETWEQMDNDYHKVINAIDIHATGNEAYVKAQEEYRARWGTDRDGYNSGGYAWCRDNWGTKWNAYEVVRRDYGGVCITFQTAWTPPIPVIAELHRRFPECGISLEYFESGGALTGGVSYMSKVDYDEYYAEEDGPFDPGKPRYEWHLSGYKGQRGG